MKIVIQELDIFILTGILVRYFGKIHVDVIKVAEGEMVSSELMLLLMMYRIVPKFCGSDQQSSTRSS